MSITQLQNIQFATEAHAIWMLHIYNHPTTTEHAFIQEAPKKQLKVLHWSLPGSTTAHIFIGGFLPLHWEHDASSMLGDSLQVWVAKAPHLSIPHLSHPSPPCCLQLHRRHRYRLSWGVIAMLHRRQKWWNGQYFCLRFLRSASGLVFNTRLDGHNKFFWL